MRKNRRNVFWPALLIAFLVLTALAFAASGKLRRIHGTDSKASSPTAPAPAKVKRVAYVRPSALTPKLVWHLKAMGNRLERPGKERLSLTGTLARANDSQAEEVAALWEFPDRLRLAIQKGIHARVITFDEDQAK